MGIFEITDDIRAIAQDAIDSMIAQLGKDCKLIYDSTTRVQCDNCFFDPVSGRSSGRYNGVGPMPFTKGKCPRCRGEGYLPAPSGETNFDIVRMLINWSPKPYNFVAPNVELPMGLVETKGMAADLPKILQCKYMIADYQNALLINLRFVRWGEFTMAGNIVKNRYFTCLWKRAGS